MYEKVERVFNLSDNLVVFNPNRQNAPLYAPLPDSTVGSVFVNNGSLTEPVVVPGPVANPWVANNA